jgi:hypothetical protein
MLKVMTWLGEEETSAGAAFMRPVGKQEPRLLLPIELAPEAEREHQSADRQILLERLQREFFWPL